MTDALPGAATDRPLPALATSASDAVATGSDVPGPQDTSEAGQVEVAERGRTTLADKVIEKIAARAAIDIAHAEGLSRRVAGREFGAQSVRAHVSVDGRVASLQLEMAVQYPASARVTTRGVREHVSERVSHLCDLTVDHIDITVAVLRRPDKERKRVQ